MAIAMELSIDKFLLMAWVLHPSKLSILDRAPVSTFIVVVGEKSPICYPCALSRYLEILGTRKISPASLETFPKCFKVNMGKIV